MQRFLETTLGLSQLTPLQLTLVTTGTFVAVALVIFLVGKLMFGVGRNKLPEAERVGSRRPLALGSMTEALALVFPIRQATLDKLRKEMQQAGYYHRRAVEEFLALRNAALIAWLLLVGTAMAALASPQENMTPKILIAGAIVLVVIYGVPRVVLSVQAHERCRRIQFSLPDALDMITMTVTGGLPLREAIKRVSKELKGTHPDIACELAMIELQTETGSLDIGLRQFAKRLDIPDITALATMVQHAERLGGQVSTAFREFADSIRRTRRQRAEERGNKASVKLLFPIVFFLAPPIYVLLLGPAFIELKGFVQKQTGPGGVLAQPVDGALRTATQANRPNANAGAGTGANAEAVDAPATQSVLR